MSDLAPSMPAPATLPSLPGLGQLPWGQRLKALAAQPAVRGSLPALVGLGAVAAAAMGWLLLSEPPQRVLYGSLSDGDRAAVVAALDAAAIPYSIEPATGALNVSEADLYRARMSVASDGALTPDSGADLLDTIPLGSSRLLEEERLRQARERELMLTVLEIDGVEAARVHLAVPERSSFIRDQAPPTASVMLRLRPNHSLTPEQVRAVTSLVAAAVPGMMPDGVRLTNQHGQLLSAGSAGEGHMTLQRTMEEKLKAQVVQLLLPVFGDGAFSAEVQVELGHAEVTRAEEAFEDGALRRSDEMQSQVAGSPAAIGVPGVLSNTPPPAAELAGQPAAEQAPAAPPVNQESSVRRDFEVGRQVSVSTQTPGGLQRLSVAVAIDAAALQAAKPTTLKQVEALIAAAVGAQEARGDEVMAMVSAFRAADELDLPFYEQPLVLLIARYAFAALFIAVLLFAGRKWAAKAAARREEERQEAERLHALAAAEAAAAADGGDSLQLQVQKLNAMAQEKPEEFAHSLRRMLASPIR